MVRDDDDKGLEVDQNRNETDAAASLTATTTSAAGTDDAERASLLLEMKRLKQELNTAQATIVRWELVNNQLMERINSK